MTVPKYEQLAEEIRQQIRDGVLKPKDRLPSNTQYKAMGWRHGTYLAAMRVLRAEGWTRGQPGEGVFVAADPPLSAPSVHPEE
jgi:DNA-binding GntR family transcriptional regulator